MSIGEGSALVIVGALLRFALARPPRYVSVRPVLLTRHGRGEGTGATS